MEALALSPDFLLPYSVILDTSFTLSDLQLQFLVKTKNCVALVVSLRAQWRKLVIKNIKSILPQNYALCSGHLLIFACPVSFLLLLLMIKDLILHFEEMLLPLF